MIKSIRNLFKLETENKPKDNIIKNMKNIFKLENGTKPIKDKIIADIEIFVNKKKIITKQVQSVVCIVTVISNMEVMVIDIKIYQLIKNFLINQPRFKMYDN